MFFFFGRATCTNQTMQDRVSGDFESIRPKTVSGKESPRKLGKEALHELTASR